MDGTGGAVQREEVVDDGIWVAIIEEACRAGVFERARRLNPSAKVWRDLHAEHHSRVGALLAEAIARTEVAPSGRHRR